AQLCRVHSALLRSGREPCPSPATFFRRSLRVLPARWSLRPRPLWRKALSATVVGVPLLLGIRYFTAEPQEKRRMRLVVDGVGRFSSWHPERIGAPRGGLLCLLYSHWTGLEMDCVWSLISRVP
uniref:AarF domain containing kinase 5 n=1 Tax=Panthera tigris altaica TaxID=74533 RepID=A0A8C9JYY1_PANTA